MARRSATSEATEAFDLFLDTASNAFGGVVFISLLVCIMVQLSGPKAPGMDAAHDPARAKLLQNKLIALKARIADLEAVRERQEKQIPSLLGTQADKGLVVEYARLTREEQKEMTELLDKTAQASRLNNQVVSLRELLEALRREQAKLAAELERIRITQRTASQQHQTLRLPRAHTADKQPVALLLSSGRLAFFNQYSAEGRPIGFNLADVELDNLANPTQVRPKPGRGVLIDDQEGWIAQLKNQLKGFDESKSYFTVAVWPDSFNQFSLLRDQLLKMRFEYALLLCKQDEPVGIGNTRAPPQ